MRRFADGRKWDVMLPYEGPGLWDCIDGVTYLSDLVILVRLSEVTTSEQPQLEGGVFKTASNRRLIDLAAEIPVEAWHPMPDILTVSLCPMIGDYRYFDLGCRQFDLVYLRWLIDSFGLPMYAQLSDALDTPLYFRFDRGSSVGFAVLQPFGNDGETGTLG